MLFGSDCKHNMLWDVTGVKMRRYSKFMPTEKQKTCPHPPSEIVILGDNITICHHCYGLLDENLKLQEEEKSPVEIVAA
jgi:hypothetical protein